jgi:hypothetical protein
VIVSLTHERVSGNVTLQSTVMAKDSNQIYELLKEREKSGDEKIILKVYRPQNRLVSPIFLSFNREESN